MRRPSVPVAAFALALAALTSCTGEDGPATPTVPAADLPAGETLLADAATQMRAVRTATFDITSKGSVDRLGIRGAKGVITREGDARGTAQLDQAGSIVELSFVVAGQTLHVKGATGGWQQVPLAVASSVYDPSRILDPDRGIANVLSTAAGARTEAREELNGTATYRVKATLNAKALAAIAPGMTEDVDGTLWVGTDRRLLHRATFDVKGLGGGGTVTVTFEEFDAPVTIRAP